MKTYYLTTKYKIVSAISPIIALLLFFGVFRSALICFGIISIYLIFFTIKTMISEHITLSTNGIEYHRLGLTFHAKWEDLGEINIHWFAPFEQEGIFIDQDLIRITEWWLGTYRVYAEWSNKAFIPLSKFSDNWRNSELGQQIEKYAPQLFDRRKQSV